MKNVGTSKLNTMSLILRPMRGRMRRQAGRPDSLNGSACSSQPPTRKMSPYPRPSIGDMIRRETRRRRQNTKRTSKVIVIANHLEFPTLVVSALHVNDAVHQRLLLLVEHDVAPLPAFDFVRRYRSHQSLTKRLCCAAQSGIRAHLLLCQLRQPTSFRSLHQTLNLHFVARTTAMHYRWNQWTALPTSPIAADRFMPSRRKERRIAEFGDRRGIRCRRTFRKERRQRLLLLLRSGKLVLRLQHRGLLLLLFEFVVVDCVSDFEWKQTNVSFPTNNRPEQRDLQRSKVIKTGNEPFRLSSVNRQYLNQLTLDECQLNSIGPTIILRHFPYLHEVGIKLLECDKSQSHSKQTSWRFSSRAT